MSEYHLRTFGGLSVRRHGHAVEGLTDHRKTLALLAVVAASGADGIIRERLMTLFWPESDAAHARGSLKQMLHFIRCTLAHRDTIVGVGQISINPARLSSDVASFGSAIKSGDDALAVSIYAGPYLDGVHIDGADELERWISLQRDRLARAHAEALERLATQAESSGALDDCLKRCWQLQSVNPVNSRYAVRLMKAMAAAGDFAGALRYASGFETLVRNELGTAPDASFARFAAELRSRKESQKKRTPVDKPASSVEDLIENAYAAIRRISIGTPTARFHLDEARAYIDRALLMEPANARGLCALGSWYHVMGVSGFGPPEEYFLEGRKAIFAALANDDRCAEVHASLAKIALYFDDDFSAALRHVRRSLELSPYDPETLRLLSVVSKILGHADDAVNAAQAAVEREPQTPGLWNGLGDALLCADRNAEAVTALKRAIRLRPGYGSALERLERAHLRLHDLDSGVEIRKSRLRMQHRKDRAALLCDDVRLHGAVEALRLDVERELAELICHARTADPFEHSFTNRTTADRIVMAYTDLGEWAKAMDWLELAYERRPGRVRRMLTDLPINRRGLATDPRYVTLMTMAGAEDLI